MAQDLELSDYTTTHELRGSETKRGGTEQSGATPTERRYLRIGILTLGVLCIVQATLNVSLRLAFYSKEDPDQCPFKFPLNSSIIADVCQIDQSQHNSTQSCTCCKSLLRLLNEYQALETERDSLRNKVIQLTRDNTRDDDYVEESGSGTQEVFSGLEINQYS